MSLGTWKVGICKYFFIQVAWKRIFYFPWDSNLLWCDGRKLAPVRLEQACSDPKGDFVDTCTLGLDIRRQFAFLTRFGWGLCYKIISVWTDDFTPKLEFFNLFCDRKPFQGFKQQKGLFFAKAKTDLFKNFILLNQVREVAAGPNLNWLLLWACVGFVHQTSLLLNIVFDLIKLVTPVLVRTCRLALGVLTVILKQMVAISVVRKDDLSQNCY